MQQLALECEKMSVVLDDSIERNLLRSRRALGQIQRVPTEADVQIKEEPGVSEPESAPALDLGSDSGMKSESVA